MLSPCRFSSSTSCTSFPLNTSRHLLFPESVPALVPVRGGGFFNRYYGDFCTGADTTGTTGDDCYSFEAFRSRYFGLISKRRQKPLVGLSAIAKPFDEPSESREHSLFFSNR